MKAFSPTQCSKAIYLLQVVMEIFKAIKFYNNKSICLFGSMTYILIYIYNSTHSLLSVMASWTIQNTFSWNKRRNEKHNHSESYLLHFRFLRFGSKHYVGSSLIYFIFIAKFKYIVNIIYVCMCESGHYFGLKVQSPHLGLVKTDDVLRHEESCLLTVI